MDKDLIEFLGKEVPSSVCDIKEALEFLNLVLNDTIGKLGEYSAKSFQDREFAKVLKYTEKSQELDGIADKIKGVVEDLDEIISLNEDEERNELEDEQRSSVNYEDYLVDRNIAHSLYENLTYKRPCRFEIEGNSFDIRDWKEMLTKLCNYVSKKDPTIINKFPDDPKMNGKKVIYFSRVKLPNMKAERKLDSGIYIETNLSSNGIRNLIIKILGKYNMKINKVKIYFRADYAELH
ncbi:hypothetical protein [Clostridium perfringens]|uniref:hypothetical protein n=1 Tax=Clostridium perfringens TaxID=1502 RepID=UPI0024BCA01D|nr:hypothetical protein [Clostridium perfringens]